MQELRAGHIEVVEPLLGARQVIRRCQEFGGGEGGGSVAEFDMG